MLDSLPEGLTVRPGQLSHGVAGLVPGLSAAGYTDPALSHMMGKFWGLLSPPASEDAADHKQEPPHPGLHTPSGRRC